MEYYPEPLNIVPLKPYMNKVLSSQKARTEVLAGIFARDMHNPLKADSFSVFDFFHGGIRRLTGLELPDLACDFADHEGEHMAGDTLFMQGYEPGMLLLGASHPLVFGRRIRGGPPILTAFYQPCGPRTVKAEHTLTLSPQRPSRKDLLIARKLKGLPPEMIIEHPYMPDLQGLILPGVNSGANAAWVHYFQTGLARWSSGIKDAFSF